MGVCYGFVAALSMAVMTLIVNSTRSDYSLGQIVFVRSFIMCLFTLPFAMRCFSLIRGKPSRLLILRSVLGAAASITYLRTLQLGHIGLANSLAVVTQVIVPVGAYIFLREKLSKIQSGGILLIVSAVIYLQSGLLGKPSLELLVLGLSSAILAAISFVMLRSLAKDFPPFLIVFCISLFSFLFSLFLDVSFETDSLTDFRLLSIGLCAICMQFFMTLSFKHLQAAKALVINESFIVFAGILNTALGFAPLRWSEWISYALILLGVGLTQVKQQLRRK